MPIRIGPLRSLRFNLQISLRGENCGVDQRRAWPLTRDAWWKINAWMTLLGYDPRMRPDDFEALVGYILRNQGILKVETGLSEEQQGHIVATQLSHFRSAYCGTSE